MHVIYVDDEMPAINNFKFTVATFPEIEELNTFQSGEEALEFVKTHTVDAAFLDMEMPGLHGLALAKSLRSYEPEIRVVFVTAFDRYALEAFGVDAVGYVLKPYSATDIRKELAKCAYKPLPSHRVVIETMPNLSVTADGAPLRIPAGKPREMLALLIDCGERGFSMGECISKLWPERSYDAATQSLYRMTWKRLTTAFEDIGAGDLVYTSDNRRYIKTDAVSCDLYRILAGDKQAARKYTGEYLSEYSWSEGRNAQIMKMLNLADNDNRRNLDVGL